MNDYDKAGRYLVKRDPTGFFRWLLTNLGLTFRAWIDARRLALPDQNDLINDLVAALENGTILEAACLELEAEARADSLVRMLEYLTRILAEPADPDGLNVSCLFGVILDMTGRSPARELNLDSKLAPGCGLKLTVFRRPMADEKPEILIRDVAAGKFSPWLLPWVPLMAGGGDSGIIRQWWDEAERCFTEERDRADAGALARVFAVLAGCRAAWEHALKEWNMKTSPIFDEIRAEGRAEGREEGRLEGRLEGREEGRLEGEQRLLLRFGRQKFKKAPTKKQQKTVHSITDLAQLEVLAERLLAVKSWEELLDNA